MALNLASFPEELVERILALCVVAPLFPPARPSWHHPSSSPSDSTSAAHSPATTTRGRLAPLLVSKSFFRIAIPLFYHTLHITSKPQLRRLLSGAVRPHPEIASYVRRIVFGGVWAEGGELLRRCAGGLRSLDVTLDVAALENNAAPVADEDAVAFCAELHRLRSLTHVAVRKPASVYLTQAKPRYVIRELAEAMQAWNILESADIAFRLSDDSISPPSTLSYFHPPSPSSPSKTSQPGPVTALTHALSTRPKLHTLATLLPSVWNEAILRVSENPRLERIVLGDGSTPLGSTEYHGIVGTGLFLMQARKHARLSELIRAGTPIIRSRAHTMGTVAPPVPTCKSSPPAACPPIRKGTSAGHKTYPPPAFSSSPSSYTSPSPSCYSPSSSAPSSSSRRFSSSSGGTSSSGRSARFPQ